MGVSKWAVPLHHVIDWHIGRLADWCEQVGGAVASLEKLSKFKISKMNMLEYVWQNYTKFIISKKILKIQHTLTFRCFKTLKIQQKLEKLYVILVLKFQIELIETVT